MPRVMEPLLFVPPRVMSSVKKKRNVDVAEHRAIGGQLEWKPIIPPGFAQAEMPVDHGAQNSRVEKERIEPVALAQCRRATVTDVNPSGPLPIGSEVTVTYLGAPETPSAPANPPTVDPSEVEAGGLVQVSWPAATCPSGQQLSGYEVAVTGDAVAPSPVGAGTTSVNVQAGQDDFEVTYRYFCGQLDSPFSPAAPVTISAG